MPYKTGIRLLGVARNPANGFPARLLEDHTLGYLVLNPIPRWWIALAKFLASVLVAGPLLTASGVATILLGLDLDWRAAATVAASLLVGVVTYSAIFTWAGLMTTRALSFALVYVFLWEGITTTFLGGVRYLSVRGYTLALLHGFDGEAFDTLGPSITTTLPRFGQFLGGNRTAEREGSKLSSVWADSHEDVLESPVVRTVVVILEVWPESHWPGFALRQTDVL